MKRTLWTLSWLTATALTTTAAAQSSTTYEDGPNGTRYQVTRHQYQVSVPSTQIQTREQKVYHPQVTTEYQSYQQTYVSPVTEYQYVPHLRNWWNPFTGAYWTHDLQPVTRWVARPSTVQVPVARTNWVESTQTYQVPVTTYRTEVAERVEKIPVSGGGSIAPASASGTAVASIPTGSQQLQSDPPRTASPWATSTPPDVYRR
jgi:hypothetical protein